MPNTSVFDGSKRKKVHEDTTDEGPNSLGYATKIKKKTMVEKDRQGDCSNGKAVAVS